MPRAPGPGPTLPAERSALAALRLPTDMSCKGLRALAMHLLLKRREPKVLMLQPHLSVGDLADAGQGSLGSAAAGSARRALGQTLGDGRCLSGVPRGMTYDSPVSNHAVDCLL